MSTDKLIHNVEAAHELALIEQALRNTISWLDMVWTD